MRLVTIALLASATLGCSTKQTTPAQACAAAANHGVDAMINQARGRVAAAQLPDDVRARILARQQRLESAGARMREVFTNRCVADAWSVEVVRCYTKVTTLEEMRACRTQLSVEQQARLQQDELALLTGTDDVTGANGPSEPGGDPRVQMIDRAIADARKTVADATTASDKAAAEAHLATLESERAALLAQSATGSGSSAGSGSGSAASAGGSAASAGRPLTR